MLFGGIIVVRNSVEANFACGSGRLSEAHMAIPGTMKVVVIIVSLLPPGMVVLMGIAGDSLLQYFGHTTHHSLPCNLRKSKRSRIVEKSDTTVS